jgi:hypothetical protein
MVRWTGGAAGSTVDQWAARATGGNDQSNGLNAIDGRGWLRRGLNRGV